MAHIIEGTWDEIKRHESELVGHHLRVIVDPTEEDLAYDIPAPTFTIGDREQLADMLTEAIQRIDEGKGIVVDQDYWDRKAKRAADRLGL